jgi:hypothetical protein
MAKLRYRARWRNHHPDLFAWAAERDRGSCYSVAARIIARRCGITESRAALVCTLAGIVGAE